MADGRVLTAGRITHKKPDTGKEYPVKSLPSPMNSMRLF
jgi:hypothetical protein